MIKTLVTDIEAKYDRHGIVELEGTNVSFDTSGGEYGPVSFPIEDLEKKLAEHKAKLSAETPTTV